MNYFPSGTYANIRGKLVHVPDFADKQEYEALYALIEQAKNDELGREEIVKRFDALGPKFTLLKVLLPTDRKEILGYLNIILIIVGIILSQMGHTHIVVMSPEFEKTIEKTIEEYLDRLPVDPGSPSKESPKTLPDTPDTEADTDPDTVEI